MITFTPVETLFDVSGFHIATTSFFTMAGILAAYYGIRKTAERRGLKITAIDDLMIALLIGGILGGRILYVLLHLSFYQNDLIGSVRIWEGGFDTIGGIIGGSILAAAYLKLKKLRFWYYADTIAPYFLLGEAIIGIGKFFTWQGNFTETTLPWGVVIGNNAAEHPGALYMALIWGISFSILRTFQKKHPEKYAGYFFFWTSCIYWITRFLMAFLETNSSGTVINQKFFTQAISLLMLMITAYCAWQQGMKVEKKKKSLK